MCFDISARADHLKYDECGIEDPCQGGCTFARPSESNPDASQHWSISGVSYTLGYGKIVQRHCVHVKRDSSVVERSTWHLLGLIHLDKKDSRIHRVVNMDELGPVAYPVDQERRPHTEVQCIIVSRGVT